VKLVYIANARIPTEKAHGLQIVKTCEAMTLAGVDVQLIVPRRVNTPQMQQVDDLWAHYGVTAPFRVVYLRCLDLQPLIRISLDLWFRLVTLTFGMSALRFLIDQRGKRHSVLIYTRDEHLAPWLVRLKRLLSLSVFFEAHAVRSASWARRLFGVDGIVAISEGLKREFVALGLPPERCLVAPDGVDLSKYAHLPHRSQARRLLGLSSDRPIVCYTGHLYAWKGVYTLVESAILLPEAVFVIVGGMPEDVDALRQFAAQRHADNVQLVGHVPPREVPLYQSAADVLVLPNSAGEKISALYTSPLKLFEYMAAGRPIVASDLSSMREVLIDRANAMLVEPDAPRALARTLNVVLADPGLQRRLAAQAQMAVQAYTWQRRTCRIVRFLSGWVRRDGQSDTE
jgi:glycosyltransferase involved in cell wall biosynthesis